MRDGLVPLIAELKARGTAPDASWLHGREYDVEKQAALCKAVAVDIGFDLERGRLDVSVHPFTGGTHPSDVRSEFSNASSIPEQFGVAIIFLRVTGV